MDTFVSELSGATFPTDERVSGESVRAPIMRLIQREHPDFDASKHLALSELNAYRERYITEYLDQEVGQLTGLEQTVLASMKNHSIVCGADRDKKAPKPTFGERISDRMTRFGGSWAFVILFGSIIVLWMAVNIFWLSNPAFDPYPFVLLNLLLSYLSTLQAPVIMMSQNRQADQDRQRSEKDYMVNLKSEVEVRMLHEKIDHLMIFQQQRLIEIQQIQIDMLTDIQQKQAAKSSRKPAAKKEGPDNRE